MMHVILKEGQRVSPNKRNKNKLRKMICIFPRSSVKLLTNLRQNIWRTKWLMLL